MKEKLQRNIVLLGHWLRSHFPRPTVEPSIPTSSKAWRSVNGDEFLSLQLGYLRRNQVWPFNPRPTARAYHWRIRALIANSLRPDAPSAVGPIQSPMRRKDCVESAVGFEPDPPNRPYRPTEFDRFLGLPHCLSHLGLIPGYSALGRAALATKAASRPELSSRTALPRIPRAQPQGAGAASSLETSNLGQ